MSNCPNASDCPDGTAPSSPGPGVPTGCCDICWTRWESTYDCSTGWGTPVAAEKECVAVGASTPTPTNWTITSDPCVAEIWVSSGTDCVSPDTTSCPDGTTPASPAIGEPGGCCATHKLIDCGGSESAIFVNDDDADWSAVSETTYDDFVNTGGTSNGKTLKFSEDATGTCWKVEEVTASAQTSTAQTITDTFASCETCIGDVCWTRWESTYNCSAGEWGTPTAVENDCVPTVDPDPSPVNWTITGVDPCVAEIWVNTVSNCISPDASGCPDGAAPATPTLATPSGCCDVCWTRWESTYDCSTDTWGSPVAAENRCVPTADPDPSPVTWAITSGDDCTAEIWVETTDTCEGSDASSCEDGTAPAKPTLTPPTACCTDDSCWTRWESTYNCDTSSWGTPVAVENRCVATTDSNPLPTSWTITSSDNCVAERWISTGENCDSTETLTCTDGTTPAAPSLGEPTGCCAGKCWARWESTYDCNTGWGTPVAAETDCIPSEDPNPSPTTWTITSGDNCVAEIWIEEGSDCTCCSDDPPVADCGDGVPNSLTVDVSNVVFDATNQAFCACSQFSVTATSTTKDTSFATCEFNPNIIPPAEQLTFGSILFDDEVCIDGQTFGVNLDLNGIDGPGWYVTVSGCNGDAILYKKGGSSPVGTYFPVCSDSQFDNDENSGFVVVT